MTSEINNFKDFLTQYLTEFQTNGYMEKMIPRAFKSEQDIQNITTNLQYSQSHNHLNSLTKSLSQPIWDLLDRGGKRWRPLLSILIAEIYKYGENTQKVSREDIYSIAALIEIVHNGTLIVDDIEDSSETRRNKECVHLLFGVDISLNAGNFMYFAPLSYILSKSGLNEKAKLRVSTTFIEEMTNLHIGQAWDILWHNVQKLNKEYPSENQYLQMTSHKTGVLARLAVRLVGVALDIPEQQIKLLSNFAEKIGVAFQIQNDLLNLEGEEYIATKGYIGQDIHEGKLSLMVLHSISNSKQADRLVEILKSKTKDQTIINEAIGIMRETDSLQYARKRMFGLLEEAWSEIENVLPEHPFRIFLRDLAYMNMTSKGT